MKLVDMMGELADLNDEVQDLVPYVRACAKAYQLIRKRRIVHFLRSLDRALAMRDEKVRRKFEESVLSDVGCQLLADYCDTVLLTSSRIAQSALALLFADAADAEFSPQLKQRAIAAFRDCSDPLVELFIQLVELPLSERQELPYTIRFFERRDRDRFPSLQSLAGSDEDAAVRVCDLIRRGLLMPDPAGARFGGGGDEWSIAFGISHETRVFHRLLIDAREMLAMSDREQV